MNKDSKEKEWKATSKVSNELDLDADISNLNDDESFVPIEEAEKEPLTEEEKKDIRKKLSFLLIIVFLVLVALVIILIFNPFASKPNDSNNNTTTEKNKTENADSKAITELTDGEISLTNKEVQTLTKEILYKQYDYYENDTLALFTTDNTYINNISDKDKLFLVAKTSDFTSLMNNKITTNDVCKTIITISKEEIDTILNSRFNTSLLVYEPFIYNIYENEEYYRTIRFVYENGSYVGSCYAPNENITTSTQQSIVSATKDKKQLYIDVKVVFVNQTGIYKDSNFTTLITDQNQSFEEYIKQGNTYRYTYDISGTSYSLINVSLLK